MGRITVQIDEKIKERERQEGRPLSRNEVARAAGVPGAALASLANNRAERISMDVLARLCEYFQCPTGDLLHYQADEPETVEDEIESREIVERWERTYGADEHPREP